MIRDKMGKREKEKEGTEQVSVKVLGFKLETFTFNSLFV